MLSGKVWPAHPQPQKDELLTSWLIRSARANATKLHTFTKFTAPGHTVWTRDIDKSASDALLEALTKKSGLSFQMLQRLTLRSYEGRLYPKHNANGNCAWLLSLGVYHRERKRFGLQVCPLCLAEGFPYYRKHWRLGFVTVCGQHQRQLLDACPECYHPIVFHKQDFGNDKVMPASKSIALCFNCDYDLRNSAPSLKPYEDDIIAFQDKLVQGAECQKMEVSRVGYVRSMGYFSVVRHLFKLLYNARDIRAIVELIAGHTGVKAFWLDTPREVQVEHVRQPIRYLLCWMVAWWLDGWPEHFVDVCKRAQVSQSYLLRDARNLPDWFNSVVRQSLDERETYPNLKRR